MIVEFVPVDPAHDIEKLAAIADEIWHEYWPEHIGKAQTDYMVEKFQSVQAIREDMANNGYEYWFIRAGTELSPIEAGEGLDETRIVGYTGGHVEPETNRFFISKIYLFKNERGRKFSSRAIEFYEQLCRDRGLRAMYLTVNKYNDLAIKAYNAKGFTTIDSVETDIGGGFIMDDFIMEKTV